MTTITFSLDERNVQPPFNAEGMAAAIDAVLQERYHDKHRFHVRMHKGELSQDEFRSWILNRFYYQQRIPVKDALVLSKLPTREDRQRWVRRITDHDGVPGNEGGIEAWLRLGEAAGLTREEMTDVNSILPGVRFAVDAYVNFCREQPWLVAVASSLTERFAPRLVGSRIGVIEEHYKWIEPEGLDYFRRRLSEAPRDAEHALELVLKHAETAREQAEVVAAVRFKCDVLWAMLDAIEHSSSCRK